MQLIGLISLNWNNSSSKIRRGRNNNKRKKKNILKIFWKVSKMQTQYSAVKVYENLVDTSSERVKWKKEEEENPIFFHFQSRGSQRLSDLKSSSSP